MSGQAHLVTQSTRLAIVDSATGGGVGVGEADLVEVTTAVDVKTAVSIEVEVGLDKPSPIASIAEATALIAAVGVDEGASGAWVLGRTSIVTNTSPKLIVASVELAIVWTCQGAPLPLVSI